MIDALIHEWHESAMAIASPELAAVEKIKEEAAADPEIRAAIEALGETVKSQPQLIKVIENWQGINIKGGTTTITGNTFQF